MRWLFDLRSSSVGGLLTQIMEKGNGFQKCGEWGWVDGCVKGGGRICCCCRRRRCGACGCGFPFWNSN